MKDDEKVVKLFQGVTDVGDDLIEEAGTARSWPPFPRKCSIWTIIKGKPSAPPCKTQKKWYTVPTKPHE